MLRTAARSEQPRVCRTFEGEIVPDTEPTPFTIAVPDADIDDLRSRLRRTRWLDDIDNQDWSYGMPTEYLRDLVGYWESEYDWRQHEARMNAYDNYRVEIDGIPIHFLWVKAKKPATAALVLTHGWPWTFWDYEGVIAPLTDPAAAGNPDGPAYDLVIPSLPGYGFSSPLRQTGITPTTTADLWATLMTRLGYDRFGAVGGDWGAFVTANLDHAHEDRLLGAYLSLSAIPGLDFTALGPDDYDGPGEEDWHARWTARMATARAHSVVHSAAPQTLGAALNDSPAGLAAWIVERRRLWSHWEGDFESVLSRDFLLTNVSIYWFTQTVGTAARFYAETARHPFTPRHDGRVLGAPTAFGVFPQDLLLLPRSLVERHVNLARWSVMPRGGHFAAAEQPALLAADVSSFFAEVAARS
jgi:pimeloyl-ACP methyl ester carboxylesterase